MRPNHPALATLRGGSGDLEGWLALFSRSDPSRGRRYKEAVSVFLGSKAQPGSWGGAVGTRSANTQRAYAYALSEFFEFLARWRGRVIAPHEVTRKDALDYVEWLSSRGTHTAFGSQWNFSVRDEKLKDGDHYELLAVYDAVKRVGGSARVREIINALPASVRLAHPVPHPVADGDRYDIDFEWLMSELRMLILLKLLHRTPTIAELRRSGAPLFDQPDPDSFVYSLPELRPVSPATITLRVQALNSFWKVLQRGENVSGEALLKYNVFEEAAAQTSRGLRRAQREKAKDLRVTPEIMRKLLRAAHGDSLTDRRNAALLWFLLLTGARVEETLLARRGAPQTETERKQWPGWLDLETKPASIMLLRKGRTLQRILMPASVLRALESFWEALEEAAAMADKGEQEEANAERLKLLATRADAPLFPPLNYWGQNSIPKDDEGEFGYRKPMSSSNVRMLLKRLSDEAELTPAERRRVHPHAFRAAAAEGMVEEGKNIREVQHILNHQSVTTTEGYLPDVDDLERLSGEAEILNWLRRGAGLPAPTPEAPRQRVVETPAVLSEETGIAVRGPEVVQAEFVDELPQPPMLPLYPPAGVILPEPPAQGLVEVGGAPESPAWPIEPYEEMALGNKPTDIAWSGIPQSKWITQHYKGIPHRFGVGKESLLVWSNPQAPFPLPVLSPNQVYPEIEQPGGLLNQLELLYNDWQATQPTSTLALAKWLQFFGSQTAGLDAKIGGEYGWSAFQAPAEIGEDLREHDTEWLMNWFRRNAKTFASSQKAFERAVTLAEPDETSEMFWQRIRTDIGVVAASPTIPEVPEYFAERDPVHAIYDRDPSEWKAFTRWLSRITGGSDVRTQNREEQLATEEGQEAAERSQARGLIETYFMYVDDYAEGGKRDPEVLSQAKGIADFLKERYGLSVPTGKGSEQSDTRTVRIDTLIDKRWPRFAAPPEPLGNIFGDSRLFRPDLFFIDESAHTVRHSEEVKREFREDQQRDSECVMRRVARALWEHVREWEYEPARTGANKRKRASRSELRRQLFIVQLAVMSFIAPCAEDLEASAGITAERPTEVAHRLNAEIRRAALGEEPQETGKLGSTARDIVDVYYGEVPEQDPMLQLEQARAREREAKYFASAQTPEDQERAAGAERERKREARDRYRANARALLPHPLRLVAATYWPV